MNLEKMFETQKSLDEHILEKHTELKGQDLFDKNVLALLVELGELCQEWRGFKYWSNDQEPIKNKKVHCENCEGTGNIYWDSNYVDTEKKYLLCEKCLGSGNIYKNPLLEEYVDGLSLVLELGLEACIYDHTPTRLISLTDNLTTKFKSIFKMVSKLQIENLLLDDRDYRRLLNEYLHLGEMLGFIWCQVEVAYYEKNKENHARQDRGY